MPRPPPPHTALAAKSGKGSFSGPPEWPRNGAVLKGTVHVFEDKPQGSREWLLVSEYKQAGAGAFVAVPEGTWMQFEQSGVLLHAA